MRKSRKIILIFGIIFTILLIICFLVFTGTLVMKLFKNEEKPNDKFTRGEWLELLGQKFNITNYVETDSYYTDVDETDVLFQYVQALVEKGVLEGNGKLNVDEEITIEEALIHIQKIYGDRYTQSVLDEEKLTSKNRVEFIQSVLDMEFKNIDEELKQNEANKILQKGWEEYFNREFKNVSEINYTDEVKLISKVDSYEFQEGKLIVDTFEKINKGDIIILTSNEEYPAGLAVKVENAKDLDDGFMLDVSEPEIEEVVDDLYIEMSDGYTVEDFVPAEGVTVVKKTSKRSYNKKEEFDSGIDGDFFELELDLKEGKVTPTAIWEELGIEGSLEDPNLYKYGVLVDDKMVTKYADPGYEIKGKLVLKDLIFDGYVDYSKKNLKFDINAGVTIEPSLEIEGKIENKQVYLGYYDVVLSFGCKIRINVYMNVNFDGYLSIKPELVSIVNVNKDNKGLPNFTGSCETDFESEISCNAKVEIGTSVVLELFGWWNVLDIYVNAGVGAETYYSTDDPTIITVEVYAPTLVVGTGSVDNTTLSSMGIKGEWKIMDRSDALRECPFRVKYEYEIINKDWSYDTDVDDAEFKLPNVVYYDQTSAEDILKEKELKVEYIYEFTDRESRWGKVKSQSPEAGTKVKSGDLITLVIYAEAVSNFPSFKLSSPREWEDNVAIYGTPYYLDYIGDEFDEVAVIVDKNGKVVVESDYDNYDYAGNTEIVLYNRDGEELIANVYDLRTAEKVMSYRVDEEVYDEIEYKYNGKKFKLVPEDETVEVKRYYYDGLLYEIKGNYKCPVQYFDGYDYDMIAHIKITDCKSDKILFEGFTNPYDEKRNYTVSSGFNENGNIEFSLVELNPENGKMYGTTVSREGVVRREIKDEDAVLDIINVIDSISGCGYIRSVSQKLEYNIKTGEFISLNISGFEDYKIGGGIHSYFVLYGWEDVSNEESIKQYIYSSEKQKIVDTLENMWFDTKFIYIVIEDNINIMDYEWNVIAAYKNCGGFMNGYALVYDGIGVFYIDEDMQKKSDYIYKGEIEGLYYGAIQIDGEWYYVMEE